jgi:hypothetical protein
METRTSFFFPPFRLELSSEQLWREDQTIALRPKAFAVLRYLVEFASAVDGVQCAMAVQQALGEKNAELPEAQRMVFRIGLNVGDVVVEGERLYGDGVNIAARLEGLAESGGLCISGTVYDQVKSKVALSYEDLGEQSVKNIAEPVRVYRVRWEAAGDATPAPTPTPPIASSQHPVASSPSVPPAPSTQHPAPLLVGREPELAQLYGWLDKALYGERQLVFVTGEPGIGKTTLVEAFLSGIGQQGTGNGEQTSQKAKGKRQRGTRDWGPE